MEILSYLLLLCVMLFVVIRFPGSKAGLTTVQVCLAFGWKLLLGCVYGLLFKTYYGGDDTWMLQEMIEKDAHLLLSDPPRFFAEMLPVGYFQDGFTLSNAGNYIWNLENWLIIKPLALIHSLTGSTYYHHIILINGLFFIGNCWLYRVMTIFFPARKTWLYLLIFFFPPAIFWLSGLRSDGYLFVCFSGLLFFYHRWLIAGKGKTLFTALLFLLGVGIFRPQVAILLTPALIAWYMAVCTARPAIRSFLLVYGTGLLLTAVSSFLPAPFNLLNYVVAKQQAFMALSGNTRFALTELQPTLLSFAAVAPEALLNTFLKPFLWEWKGFLQLVTAIENLLLPALLLWLLSTRPPIRQIPKSAQALLLFLVFFSISYYLFIGYTVPFPGAIVRYKIIPELLLLCSGIVLINYHQNKL